MKTAEEQKIEILVLIDDFIHDISGKNLVETATVIDRLLDIRNTIETTTAPI